METTKVKRQQNKNGHIFTVPLADDYIVFGRVLSLATICIYRLRIKKVDIGQYALANIIKEPVIIYTSIYKQVISRGEFTVIGNLPVSQEEIDAIPPFFRQKIADEYICTLGYLDRDVPATPEECLGYPRSASHEGWHLIERIEAYYAGKKCLWTEQQNVVLPPFPPKEMHYQERMQIMLGSLMKDPIPEDDSNYYGIPRKYPQVYPMPKPPKITE